MDKLGIKGTLYDLLGYIIPGAFFIFALYIMYTAKTDGKYINLLKDMMDAKSGFAFGCLAVICSYINGHILASIGSILFENRFVKWLFSMKAPRWLYRINEDVEGEKYRNQFEELVGDKAVFTFRDVIAYSEENTKTAYDTAFVFLSIYGLSRNIAVAMLLLFLSHLTFIDDTWDKTFYICYFLALIALLHNYFRFRQYYIAQIYASLSAIRQKNCS